MAQHKSPSLAADAAVLRKTKEGKPQLLMIRRKGRTFHNYLAFPGGFVEYGEDPKKAVVRELKEETSLDGGTPQLVGVYGDPQRDPRGHIVSIFYYVPIKDSSPLQAGDDAGDAQFFDLEAIQKEANENHLAFDHAILLQDLLQFCDRNKIYDTLVTQ